MKKFNVKGGFRIGDVRQPFSLIVEAKNESTAKELTYTRLGSNHKCKRRFINIEVVSVVKE